jgi:hypothetical protein
MISTSAKRKLAVATALATTAAGLALALTPRAARADATAYCLDSRGDTASFSVPAYLYQYCSNPSNNLRWTIRNGQIINAATGYCLDSRGDTASFSVPAYLYQYCSNPSTNLRWTISNGQIINAA